MVPRFANARQTNIDKRRASKKALQIASMAAITNVGIYWMIFIGLMLGPMGFADIFSTDKKSSKYTMRLAIDGDYIGCYQQKCMESPYHLFVSTLNTPDSCTAKCKEDGFLVATLYNLTKCGCTCLHGLSVEACLVKKLEDNFCGLPCQHNSKKMCGGYTAMAVYRVALKNASKTNCSVDFQQNRDIGDIDSNGSTEAFGFVPILIIAGVGATVVISLVVTFACVRKVDRRVIYSPRDHSSRWRAHATTQELEERPLANQQNPSNILELPPRSLSSMQQASGADSEPNTETLNNDTTGVEMPVVESNFYHVLANEDNIEMDNGGLSPTSENAYAYADCQSYMDSFVRSAAFIQRHGDMKPYPEDTEEIEHGMINNELYAISHK
ncbi:uncharacterized protein LOC129280085 [Lytechinus pictus]|uniref:uncharacterized protein LOC129280085 n=1 Tax=Lytechinus pictus TaxID=7653 RepID=UPI0030BA0810